MAIDYTNIMKDKTAYLNMKEINKILQYCYSHNRIRDYMLILTLVRTGRRVGEIVGKKPYTNCVGFRPCDILDDGLIEFDILKKNHIKSKTSKGNLIEESILEKRRFNKKPVRKIKPVDDEYYRLIKSYVNVNKIPKFKRIFPITQQRVGVILKNVAKKCNVYRKGGIHPHILRHSFAIHLLKENPNDASTLIFVQQMLEHSNINVTMTYAQFTQEDKKEKLNQSFN